MEPASLLVLLPHTSVACGTCCVTQAKLPCRVPGAYVLLDNWFHRVSRPGRLSSPHRALQTPCHGGQGVCPPAWLCACETCRQLCRESSLPLLNFPSGHEDGPRVSEMCSFLPSVPVWPLRPEHQLREHMPPIAARHLCVSCRNRNI